MTDRNLNKSYWNFWIGLVALDPAGPAFSLEEPQTRFDRDDAEYTVGIYTNAGSYRLGFPHSVAHIDFLPNGGVSQPGCYTCMYDSITL